MLDREALAKRPMTAGAVFIGPYTAQAAGDYATGSNHVLPTAGAARYRGGLSAADFVRVMSVQRVTRAGPGAAGADDPDRSPAPRDSRRTPSRLSDIAIKSNVSHQPSAMISHSHESLRETA